MGKILVKSLAVEDFKNDWDLSRNPIEGGNCLIQRIPTFFNQKR
jgi:hypothetical protein